MTSLTITIPQPIEWLNSNDRLHHMVKARRVAAWRGTAKFVARGLAPIEGRVHIVATIHKRHGRRYDAGNYYPTAKACVDGLRDAGLLAEDDNAHVVGPDMRHGGKSAEPNLTLTITELEETKVNTDSPYHLPCPKCGAPSFRQCRSLTKGRPTDTHAARLALYVRPATEETK